MLNNNLTLAEKEILSNYFNDLYNPFASLNIKKRVKRLLNVKTDKPITLNDRLFLFKLIVLNSNTETSNYNINRNSPKENDKGFLLNSLIDLNRIILTAKDYNSNFNLDFIIEFLEKNSYEFDLVYSISETEFKVILDVLIKPLIDANYLTAFYDLESTYFYYILFDKKLKNKTSKDKRSLELFNYYFSPSLFAFLIALYGNEASTIETLIKTY